MSEITIPPRGGALPTPTISSFLNLPVTGLKPQASDGRSFSEHLAEVSTSKEVDVRFSAHAMRRLESRGIELPPKTWEQLDQAIDLARDKGAHDSLIMIEGNAFVVNIDNRTVVTAMDQIDKKGGVFTKIDSTIVMS